MHFAHCDSGGILVELWVMQFFHHDSAIEQLFKTEADNATDGFNKRIYNRLTLSWSSQHV